MKFLSNKGVQGTAHRVRCPLTPDVGRNTMNTNKKQKLVEQISALKSEQAKLEKEWDRIDNEGSQAPQQNQISKQLGIINDQIEALEKQLSKLT